jgi:[acyl-carrier-protein] S-malonyltransferase
MSDRPRAVVACPGRGAYTAASLGSLPADHPAVARAEQLRTEYGLEPLLELDHYRSFDPPRHLRAANASPLIFLASLLDAERAAADHEFVGIIGNSMGWYTALALAGALAFDDAYRLVQEMAILQEQPLPEGGTGGQVIYPQLDADWSPAPELRAAVRDVLGAQADHGNGAGRIFESIDLGAYAVLAGDDRGVATLIDRLPPVRIGERLFPLRLALHGPYHTPLVDYVAETAGERLAGLRWQRPAVTLVDGRGTRWSPWSTDPAALRDYTLGEQVTSPFRFAASLRVALRELAPDVLVLPGPGNSLGGICGQLIVAEGYRSLRSRRDFEQAQRSASPIVLSMGHRA